MSLQTMSEHLKTFEVCKEEVSKDGSNLQWVPEQFKASLVVLAIEEPNKPAHLRTGMALQFFPEEMRTLSNCRKAVYSSFQRLYSLKKFIPDEYYVIIEEELKYQQENIGGDNPYKYQRQYSHDDF